MSKLNFLYGTGNQSEASKMLGAVRTSLQQQAHAVTQGGMVFAKESADFTPADREQLQTSLDSVATSLERGLTHEGVFGRVSKAGLAAAKEGMLMAKNVAATLRAPITTTAPVGVANFAGIVGSAMGDASGVRMQPAREAYDERDNMNVVENTVTYNLLAGRQAPAAELFFPTTAVPGDNTGISVTIRLYQVTRDNDRKLSGDKYDLERRNLIDGMIDDTILRNDSTRATPIFRAGQTSDKFMTGVTPVTQVIEGVSIQTAPLRFNTTMDLLALSANDAMLAAGIMDRTDSLDSDVKLVNLYLTVGDDVIRVRTDAVAGNNFIYVGQGNYREQRLSLRTATLYIDKHSKTFADAPLSETDLQPIILQDYIVRLSGVFSGMVNIEDGNLQVESAMKPKVEAVLDYNTKAVITTTTGAAIKTALEAGEWTGFDVEARRANSQRRERGDLVDTQYYTQQWAVPLRSPVTSLRPVNASGTQDSDDLEKLATTTYIRTSGAAYVTVLDTVDQLRQMRGLGLEPRVQPETLGVGRHLLTAMLIEEEMDAAENVASLRSADLEDDISATMVNRIRDMFYRLYRDSKFQAVVESGAAGTTEQPTCIVMADPMTARYLMIKGEIRTIGPDFKMIVQTTPNKRIEDKIIIAMGYPEKSGGTEINALHFGAMLWSPELALVLPISRKGQTSKELTVQPRFRHIVNVPVLGVLTVKNLSEVVHARVPVDFNQL